MLSKVNLLLWFVEIADPSNAIQTHDNPRTDDKKIILFYPNSKRSFETIINSNRFHLRGYTKWIQLQYSLEPFCKGKYQSIFNTNLVLNKYQRCILNKYYRYILKCQKYNLTNICRRYNLNKYINIKSIFWTYITTSWTKILM